MFSECSESLYENDKKDNDDTDKGLLVGVNIGEDVNPGVDCTKVEMTLVLNHHPKQPFHLVDFESSRKDLFNFLSVLL